MSQFETERFDARMLMLETIILRMEKRIMTDIENLAAAVARNNASTLAELKAIADKLAALGASAGNDPAIAQAVTDLNALSSKLDAETVALTPAP